MSTPCKCGRPRYTGSDLERWLDEQAAFLREGGTARMFNPPWARAICWTIEGVSCNMKPLGVAVKP